MWIDDEIRNDSLLSKWHILLLICHSDCAFLAVSRSKFVSNLRNPDRSHLDFGERSALLIDSEYDRVNLTVLRMLELRRHIFSLFESLITHDLDAIHFRVHASLPNERSLSDDDIISADRGSRLNDPVLIELVISAVSSADGSPEVRYLKFFVL